MKKLLRTQTKTLLEATSNELRNLEFKPPFSWIDTNSIWLKEKVTRAILGMTNTKSGGRIIIGIKEDRNRKPIQLGLTKNQIESFTDYEGIKGFVDGFADSDTNFNLAWGEYNNKGYIFITIQEFYEYPVLCKKDGQKSGVLRKDDLYVRSKKAPYSTIRATGLEFREIIKLAADKEREELKERRYIKQTGIIVTKFYKDERKDLD